MVAINLAGTAAFISVFFWLGRDYSPLMLLRWAVLFGPRSSFRCFVGQGRNRAGAAAEAGAARAAPGRGVSVWVGIMTLGAAIALLERLR
jgi:hypothetical protein